MDNKGTVKLETERLILRKARPEDAEPMFRNWAGDSRVTEFMTWQPYKDALSTMEYIGKMLKNYENDSCYDWFIELKQKNEPIGSISVVALRDDIECAVIGYCLGYDFWHKGIMTEAFTEVIRFLFEEVGVNRIEATHNVKNSRSGEVMKKCGLQFEGIHRQAGRDNTGIVDTAYYSILRDEYFS